MAFVVGDDRRGRIKASTFFDSVRIDVALEINRLLHIATSLNVVFVVWMESRVEWWVERLIKCWDTRRIDVAIGSVSRSG